MARLVCLYIEDNDEAAQVLEFFEEGRRQGFLDIVSQPKPPIPLALFAVPTQYCQCPERIGDNKVTGYSLTRGGNLGWWIHNKEGCYKPTENGWQSPKNLLTPKGEHSKVHVNWTFQPPTHLKTLMENGSSLGST
jgi:hypothetical protein